MSDDPKPNLPPDPKAQKLSSFWFRFLFWVKRPSTIAIMFSLVALGTGATVWAYLFITQKLVPLVSEQMTKIVNRPFELGSVERFSLNSIRFGRSVMPPTDSDPDRLSIEGVKVGFNIVPLLLKRSLPVTITLEKVNAYIEQDESGAWLDLNITTEDKPLPIEIPTTIKIPDAQIVLLAKGKTTPLSVNIDLKTQLSEKFKQAKYDVNLGIKTGKVTVKGQTFLATGESKVNARIDNFALTDLNPIIPDLPINLTNGLVAANLDVNLPSFQDLPTVLGSLGFREIEVNGDILPEKLLANGLLRFQGQTVKLEDLQASLGAIAAEVSGQVDLNQGFNVAVDVNPFSLNSLLELAQVDSPIFLDGDMAVNLQVTGPLKNPQVVGKVEAIRNTRIDRVDFEEISLNFLADLQQFTLTELRILPLAGGQITGEGEVKFPSKSPQDIQLAFDFGADLPINAIASPYNLPPELAIGNMKTAAKIRGTADNPEASLNWRLPAAEISVPNPNNPLAIALSGFGEIIFRDKIVRLRNTFLTLGDGSITLAGNGNLETKKWQFSMAAASFTLDPFLPVPIKLAIANANTKASGSLDNPDPKAIAASGELGLNIEGGTIQGEGQLDRGNISASAAISQIELSRFTNQFNPPLPLTLLAGDIKLSGSLDNLGPGAIQASANLGLKVADGLVNIQGEINSGLVKAGVTTSAINLARIVPQLPIPITLLGSQVNLSASIASLTNAAISAKSTNEGLPTGLNLNGIDLNTDIRLKVAEALVNAQAQINSGAVKAALNTTEIDVLSLVVKKPGFLEKPSFLPELLADVKLLGIQANLSSSLAALINAANQFKEAITRQELPPADSLTGIDLDTDIRLKVAEGLVNAQAQINSGKVNAALNTTEIDVASLLVKLHKPGFLEKPGFFADVKLLGIQANLSSSLAALINAANQSKEAIARQELPPADSLNGININTDIRLAIADGLVNAQAQINSGKVNAALNTTEIDVLSLVVKKPGFLEKPGFLPELLADVKLLVLQANLSSSLAALINAANQSKEAIARQELPPADSLNGININTDIRLAVADSLINTKAQLNADGVKVRGNGEKINLAAFLPNLPLPVGVNSLQFNLATSLQSLLLLPQTQDFRGLDANVNMDLIVGDGRINVEGRLNAGSLLASAKSSDQIYLPKLSPQLPIPITIFASGFTLSAGVNPLISAAQKIAIAGIDALNHETLRDIQVNGNVDMAIAQGRVSAIATVRENQWQTAINTVNIQLLEFAAFLPPTVLENQFLELNPDKFQLNSQANLAGKIAPLFAFGAEPVAIELQNVSAQLGDQSLKAKGSIVLTDLITNPDVSQLQLELMVRSNLNTLPVNLPPQVVAQGQISFDGRLEGKNLISDPLSPGNLQFISDLRWENVAVNEFKLDPILAGKLNIQTGKEVAIALKGKRDILSAQLAACNQPECLLPYLPVALAVKLGLDAENTLIINGNREGDRFNLNLEEFSLGVLNIAPAIDYGITGTVGGNVSANLGINLFTLASSGNLRITKPSVGYIQAEEFATNFAYKDGIGQIPQGYLKLGQSQYEFEGGVNLNTRAINGKITTNVAQVEDILNTFSWYRFEDLIRNIQSPNTDSGNLQTASRGLPNESLINQLRRFAEINALLQRNAEDAKLASPPNLIDIRGGYQADILIAGTVENPQFDLKVAAQNLEWRTKPPVVEVGETGIKIQDYKIIPIDRVIVQANFKDGFFTVQPMRVEFGDTLISFVGKLGLESTTGKFQMEKLSLDTLRNFVEIPGVKIDGNINANAVLAGTINNPQIRGDISLTEGEINDQAVDRVFGTFSLSNQRLLFATTQPSSLQVFGSVPVPPVPGKNDMVSLNLNIGTEAIALLNLFTQRQLEWISGEGDIKLSAKGKLDLENRILKQLEATGAMTFQNAVLKTATLDEALTINGQIAFDQERIRIDQFAGTFANSILTAQGVLPILEPLSSDDPDLEYPMTISLNEGKINLENIYKGKVGGEVTIAGAIFRPIIGGEIRLYDGKASVPKRDETTSATFTLEEKEPPIVPILDNFRIILGNKFELENWPLFDFRITGDLTVNGSLYDLKPDGIIQLVRGQINLFSSQFFVTRNYEQIVEFSPDWGLDPNLNIQLGTVVLEKSSEQRLPDSESEIADPLVFSARPDQINVQLTIKGRSSELLAAMDSNSQLLDLVELTSIPSRNKSEIISLLGNKFLTTLEEIQRLPGDLSNRSSREWLELAINNFIVKPYVQELQFTLEDMVTKNGRKIGLEDLRVYPTIEGIYQINEQSFLGISYDYNYQQFEVEYKIRF